MKLMSEIFYLAGRSIIAITGDEAASFLEGLVTQKTDDMGIGEMRYGALLTPQGKITSDMLMLRFENGFYLDVPASLAEALLKRLTLYKLRARLDLSLRDDLQVLVSFDDEPPEGFLADPRHSELPWRAIETRGASKDITPKYLQVARSLGVAHMEDDFATASLFPTDINMDAHNGVDYKKGCFVGQEVVSRMKRRGNIRKRVFSIFSDADGLCGVKIQKGESSIGEVLSFAEGVGLGLVRLDRFVKAEGDLSCEGETIKLEMPVWAEAEIAELTKA